MPCNTIQTVTVQEELLNLNLTLLQKALVSMGFSASIQGANLAFYGVHSESGIYYDGSYMNGKFTSRSQAGVQKLNTAQVKQAYSAQVIKKAAVQFGWKLTKKSAFTYEVEKR